MTLPPIARTRALLRTLAVLDAIIEPQWESRYYSFDQHWDDDAEMGSMRTGEGDQWWCWLGPPGVAIIGHDHEVDAPVRLDRASLPVPFRTTVLEEPAFESDRATFLLWRQFGDDSWHGSEPDPLLGLVVADDPAQYVSWAESYYEVSIDADAVERIWKGEPLTDELVGSLNDGLTLTELAEDLEEIGYPTG